MTARTSPQPARAGIDLAEDASPAEIVAALLPEERERFITEYRDALDDARATLSLTALSDTLDRWRALALFQADPEDFARLVRTAAERLTGASPPPDEPLSATRARIGLY